MDENRITLVWRRALSFTIKVSLLLVVLTGLCFGSDSKPAFKKVVIVILENEKISEALAQPYLAKIAKQGALLKNYHGVTHPSQPNYVAMVAGDTLGVKNDHVVTIDKSNIVDLLEAKGKTWKV